MKEVRLSKNEVAKLVIVPISELFEIQKGSNKLVYVNQKMKFIKERVMENKRKWDNSCVNE